MLNIWENGFGPPLGNYNRSDCYVWCVHAEDGGKTRVVYDADNNARIYQLNCNDEVKAISRIFESTKYDNDSIDFKVWDDRIAYLIPKKQ